MNTSIDALEVSLGIGVEIHPSASIRGLNGPAKRICIGDHTYIGADVQIICDDFSIGDYGKIHHHVTVHGYQSCHIGHNAWIGQFTIIDSIGGTKIGDNCGIGAHSQLWSHIKFGDTLEGCRFNAQKPLILGNDVWLVGHCIVGPIRAADKSMALAGSVVTSDMEYNQIYAGTPAKSVSKKLGYQFEDIPLEKKLENLTIHLEQSGIGYSKIQVVASIEEVVFDDIGVSYFSVKERKYSKRCSPEEIAFMKYLLPEKAKFVPF